MKLSYPPDLPISSHRDEIVGAIKRHRVVVIAGDTGSGKTTQIPKMCLDAGRGTERLIGCTQPRRIAAISVAERVAEEMQARDLVGYKIRFLDKTSGSTRIKFMTDGVLLAETKNDKSLKNYDTLIIDEAHERSLNIDFLLGYVKTLLARRSDLKLIIASATLDTEKFSAHFQDAPIINVSGRTFPIEMEYVAPDDTDEGDLDSYVDLTCREALNLVEQSLDGDILIFMPTERDILDCTEMLEKKLAKQALILPLFGRLHAKDQRKIFRPSRQRKIIIATNIAETSLTVPGIKYVIDTGLARISRYNPRARSTSLQVRKISRASCDQRAGRCGRTGPGHCIRLYTEEDYLNREQFTQPEIQRSNLAEVILQMTSLRLGDPRQFPFLDPPTVNSIRDGFKLLHELNALTHNDKLTGKGKIMASLPLDPCISRIIIEAAENGALREIKVIAAGLSIMDPRVRPLGQETKADESHRRFCNAKSDFLTLLQIWDTYIDTYGKIRSKSKLKKFCTGNYLSWQRMREWQDIHDQINQLLKRNRRFHDNTKAASFEAVHQSLLSGFIRNIGQKKEKNLFTISGGREAMIFPGSSLFNKAGQWIVAASFMETGRLYAMSAASIDVRWLERIGGDLCRYSWSQPHWEKRSGRVVAVEKVTLFGLVIVAGRKVNYAGTSDSAVRESREIFLREALVAGELGGRYAFLQHNKDLIQQVQDMEHRTRRNNILVDDEIIYSFYNERLGMVHDRQSLKREIKKHNGDRFLWMTEEDIIQAAVHSDELYLFPEIIHSGKHPVRLQYCFEPGSEADGITADIPIALGGHINPAVFEWLVPGLLEEKILALLKGLPKQLRRRLVPLPDAAARILDSIELYQGSLYAALEKSILKLYQLRIQRTDWQPEKLAPHLKMRFRLKDENNATLHTSRNYQDLLARTTETTADDKNANQEQITLRVQKGLRSWDFPEPPQPVPRKDNKGLLAGFYYPSLVIDSTTGTVELHHTADLDKSRLQNQEGLRFLYGLQFPKETKAIERECRDAVTSHSASWLSLGLGIVATELSSMLKDFLLDDIFEIDGGHLPSKEDFSRICKTAMQNGIIKGCRSRIDHLLKLLSQRRQLQVSIENFAHKARGKHDPLTALGQDFSNHLETILPADFLVSRRCKDLRQTGRYLKALGIRMERAMHSPAKDKSKALQVSIVANRLKDIAVKMDSSTDCLTCLAEYRTMVEEFRVSVFAPELGTAFPVSEKRLARKWQEVVNLCHRVE